MSIPSQLRPNFEPSSTYSGPLQLTYDKSVNSFQLNSPSVAVIGGGISGLAAAHRLTELEPSWPVTLFESTQRLGGVIGTDREDGFLIERAADNFLQGATAPWAVSLCERIGFKNQLIPTNEDLRGAKIYWNGKLHSVPAGFQLMAPSQLVPLLTTSLLSPLGKLRLICEPLIREADVAEERSLASFAKRRLGREAYERLVEPLVAGIYTADPEQLSVDAALPQMVQLVREHGSLYRGMRKRRERQPKSTERGARYSLFVAPRDGMSSLVDALSGQLKTTEIRCQTQVEQLRREEDSWNLQTQEGRSKFDAVIVSTPNYVTANLLHDELPELAQELQAVEYASSAVVCLAFEKRQISRPLGAFGCVIPSAAGRPILAISCASAKFPDRAPAGMELFRVFLGGALRPEIVDLSDAELIATATSELSELLGIQSAPHLARVVRWPRAMPQYAVGHLARLERIRSQLPASGRLQLAGNSFSGVGIPQCVCEGEAAAERIVAALKPS